MVLRGPRFTSSPNACTLTAYFSEAHLLRNPTLLSAALLFTLIGCRSEGDTDTTEPDSTSETGTETETETGTDADWGELEDDDGSSDKDKGGYYDTGKDGTGSCGSEVKAGAPCEGDWEETLCQDERGDYWWCENGTWTSK